MTPTTITIGGRSITIVRCSATEALDLELSLAKVAGNVDTSSLGAAAAGDMHTAIALGVMESIGGVAKNLTLAELTRLMNLLFKYVTIDGKTVPSMGGLDAAFADRPADIWQVFIAAVKHNLGPLGDVLPKNPATSPIPTTT